MVDNTIALQARAPQIDWGAAAQRYGNTMAQIHQMKQADNNLQLEQQKLDFQSKKETQQAKTNDIEYATKVYEFHRNQAPAVQDPQTYSLWLQGVAKDSPETAAMFTQSMPVDKFDTSKFAFMLGKVDDVFGARFGKATTSTQFTPGGDVMSVNSSSIPGASFAQKTPDITGGIKPANAMTPPSTAVAPANAMAPKSNKEILRSLGSPLPDAVMKKNGITPKPISFNPDQGNNPDMMPQIIDAAVRSGSIDETHLQQLRKIIGPENDEGLATFLKKNNVQIQLSTASRGEQMPVNYGGLSMDGANEIPFRQDIQYAPNSYPQAQVKPPIISPQANPAPAPVVLRNAQAQAQGEGDVNVNVKPIIAGKSKGAELSAQKQADFPKSTTALQNTLTDTDDFIATAKQLKQHPALNRIIGPIDAYTPNFGEANDAQRIYDTLMSKATFNKSQSERAKTQTGGSPVGNASDADMKLMREAVGALSQAQTEKGFNVALDHAIDLAAKIRQNTIDGYKREYKGFTTPDFLLHPQSQAPGFRNSSRPGKKVGQFVVTQVSD